MRYDALDSGRRMHLLGVTAGQVPKRSNGWKETTAEKLFVVSALPLAEVRFQPPPPEPDVHLLMHPALQ